MGSNFLVVLAVSFLLPFAALNDSLSTFLRIVWWAVLPGLFLGGIIDYFVPDGFVVRALGKRSKATLINAVITGFRMSACSHGILRSPSSCIKRVPGCRPSSVSAGVAVVKPASDSAAVRFPRLETGFDRRWRHADRVDNGIRLYRARSARLDRRAGQGRCRLKTSPGAASRTSGSIRRSKALRLEQCRWRTRCSGGS